MKKLKKILSVLTLIVLVGSDFLTSISYALEDVFEDSVVVQTEDEEAENLENEEENVEEEDSEFVYEDVSIEDEDVGETVEGVPGEILEIESGELGELTEETVEGATLDIVEGITGDVEELTGTVDENTGIEEETVIEEIKYNEKPIIGEEIYNDVTVRVEALTGIFPEGTELKIEPIKWGDLSSLKDKLVKEKEEIKEDTTIVAFDITFNYEGEEVQPKDGEKVKVTFDYSRNENLVKADKNENQEVKVYHIEDKDEEGNKVVQGEENVVDVTNKQESAEIGIAVVDADSFSIYVVTYGNEDPEFSATLVGEDSARNNFHYKTITISDGENTYTLMDRNLGARVAWNTGTYAFNDKSNYNTEDDYYGYYYQWGNNYGFSNTQKYGNVISDAIPSNYVSSSWSTSNLGGYNLRGDTTNTESARQGPCPRGWHVPSANEWEAIKKAWCMSYNNTENCQGAGRQFAEALQMPTAGYRYYNYGKFIYSSSGSNGYYWSSTSNDNSKANYLFFRSSNVNINTDDRVNGLQVRCLKNNTDAVTLYLNPNGGRVEDGIKDADAQGKVILPIATRNEYNFDGWYDAVDGGNRRGGSGDEITINEDTDLYAHWSEIIPNPIVIFNNGADITEFEVESGGTLTNEQIQQILNLTHTKATFDGWYKDLEFTHPFDFNTIITEDTALYAKWTCKPGYTTLQGNGGPDMNCFEYETISYEYDGNKHVLMDRNLGAQMIGFGREADLKSYGYYYQWGNNYGFGPFTTPITSNTQVDCTNINPSTYSRSTFITGSSDFDWCSPRNDNLWGGNGDGLGNNRGLDAISATVIDRQGPCPRGWHVPSAGERQTLLTYWVSLNGVTRDSGTSYEYRLSNFTRFSDDFKMPLVGRRAYEGAQLGGGGSVYLWSSSPNVDDDLFSLARNFDLSNTDFLPYANSRSYRAYGMPVRCFMNNPKTITFNYNGGEGENFEINVPSGTKVTAPADPTNGDQIFAGWYEGTDDGQTLSATAFDFNEEITQNVDLYAKWVSCEDGEIYSPELGKCVARWHELVSLTDDNTTATVGSGDEVQGLPTTVTIIENYILESTEGEDLSEIEGKELVGDITINFGGDAKFSHLVQVKIPVTGSSKAYVKVKHVGSDEYNYDGLTRNIDATCNNGNIENPDNMYDGTYIDVESGYVSIYTCRASDFAAFGLPKVTFELENGSGAIVVEVESGAMVSSEDIPTVTKSGYNFSGWYLTGAESAFDFSGTAITGDITLYAKWQEDEGVTYTVSFDANRGTFADTPASQNVLGGGHATDPATLSGYKEPELPGYDFDEWWTEPRGGTQWNFANDVVTGNITLYAHWTYKEIFGDLDVYMIDSNGSLIKYVMMDRNLGATGVYNKNFDSQNPNSFGFVYQWGNNYGFPRCNGNATCNYSPITDTPVSVDIVENYIPSKFASSIWIGKNGGNGSSKSWHSNSGNVLKYLWGNGNTIDMQGPCPDGYHVPLTSETNDEGGLFRIWGNIYDKTTNTIAGKGEGISFISDDQKLFTFQFLFPHAGNHKKGNTKEQEQNMCGDYWTATPSGLENAINIWFCKDGDNNYYDENGKFLFTNNSQRNNGSTLRCFKNSTGSANLDIVNGGKKGLITVDKVDGVATINAIKEPENTDANGTGLIFGGWYTSPNFEPNTMKTGGDTLPNSVTALYAKWDCPDGLVYNSNNQCISGVLVRFMDGETEYTRSVVLSGEEVRAPATNPKKAGHIFTGWFEYGAELPFVFTGTPITGNLDLYAHWEELPETEALIIVNYYLKKLDVENNVLTGGVIVYSTGLEFTGEIADTLNISGTYLTGIVGYQYDHATVFSGEDEILEDEIYLDENKEINMYYIPEQNQFTLNTVQYSNTDGSSVSGMYYYGAKVILSGSSSDDHYLWSGWIGLPEGTPNSAQTEFYMPNSAVTVTSSVREKIYDVYTVTFKNRNGDFLWSGKVVSGEMPTYSGSTPSRSSTEQVVYNFNGWYPELSPVTGNITYTATYTEAPRLYTVILTGTPAGYGTLSTGSLSKEYETAIVISGSQLTIGGTEVILTGNDGYEFQEWTSNCGYVERPICNENIIYTHPGVIEFTGSNNLIIRNPGYDLFSEANFHKDFEISFNILNLDLKNSVNQATLISVKNEDLTNVWPGFTVRRGSATNYQITANGGIQSAVTVNRPAAGVNSLKIKRKNNILYISENDGEDIQIYNYTGFSDSYYFDNPIAIGSIYKEQTGQRYIKATLSDIVIKSMDTSSCSSGLVLAVTGDCQMTAVFSTSDSHEVRIASNNTGYGTVSTGSVTKPHGTPITDNGNGTLTIDDVTVTATTGAAPAGYTYTFSGWIFSSECGSGGNYAVAEGCTITGNFEETLNTYTVTFDLSGGSLTGDMTLTKEYTIETPTISLIGYEPERNGYTFTGWYRDGTLVTSMAGGETGDYTLVARWEAQERPIPVVVFMKMLVPGEYTDYDSNLEWGWGTVGELYTAPIEQFTHTGFYYEEDNENNVRSVIVSPNVDNEVHLYFSRIPYPLIITNAGEGISSTTTGGGDHLYEEPVTISVTPYTGWDFVSWSLSQGTLSGVNDLTQRTLSFNMPAEQVMISPILNHIEYTLSFDSASGTAVENQTYYYNDLLSGLDNAITTRTGYDFSGWYLSGVLYTSGSTMPAEDITLTAVWDINEYEVDASVATGGEGYLSGMGSTGISLTGLYDYATELVFIAIPELGYVFDYWKNGDTVLSGTDLGDGTNQLTVVVDQILDIIAFFKPADDTPYTVEHYQANVGLTGYDFVWSGTMYGTTNTQTNATGTDYEGFSLHNGNISEYQTGIKADGSTVVKLYYDRNRYIVTWNTWNGYEVTRTDVAYGQHPHFYLTPPERDILDQEDEDYDFTFTGWTRSGVSGIVDLETEIVTGDITYTAEYDRTLKYYTVKYYPGEGTGIMPDQTNLQLHTSGNLIKNTFTRTGYIFSGRYSSMGLRYEDEQEINMGRADGFEYDLSGNFFLSLEAQWKPSTDTKVTVNYYLKNLDVENNVLTGGSREYLTGVEFTGTTDDIVDILTKYGTGIEGYEYSKSIVYGPDFPGGVETGTTTILADGDRVIEMYYVSKKYNFTLNTVQYSSTAGSSESTGYYYGAKVTLGGDSSDDCFMWSGWTTTGITLSDNTLQQTWFTMPANNVTVASSVREKTYDVTFNGGDGVQGSMESLSGVVCTENITLNNNFSKTGYTFTGWSTISGGTRSYTSGQVVSGLSKNDGENVNLYAIWDINQFDINVRVATGDEGKGYLSGMGSVGVSLTGLYDFGETLVVIAVPELGYLFDYWEVNESTELPEGVTASGNQLTVVVDQILDVVAHFKENVGTVTVNYYEMNTGGTYPGVANTATFTGLVGYTGYATLQPPVGFYLDTTSTVNTGIVISENNAENVINIYYARNKHNITLGYAVAFLNPGSVTVIPTPRESGYYYGEDVHFEAIVSTGYVFKQWRVNGVPVAGGADGVDFVMGDEDVNLVVDGDLITYNIDYYTDPGSTDPYHENPHSYTVLSGEITINEPIAEFCHNFLGWTGGTTGDWILTPTTGLVIDSSKGGDRKYYANWERKSYDVELSVDPSSGGTVTGAGTYRCMGEIELHATSNTGYHFVGWYDTGGNLVSSNSMYFFRAPVGSLGTGLIAKFERNQYYVTIDKNGSGHFWGESAPSGRYYHGTPITFIASPSNGYKIQKWTRNRQNIMTGANNELYTGYILDVTVTETGNYEVYFEPETYNIIYMDSGSILTGLSPTTYTVENHVYSGDLPSITKDGYIFAGWFYEYPRQPQYQIQEIGYVPVDGQSVTILAGWMPIDYNIRYHLLTGVETIPWEEYYPYESYQSYNIETVRTNLPRVEKDGYIFSGWVDNYGKSLTGFGGGMTGDLDLYPTWKSDVMDITVNYYEMDTNGDYSYIYETYNYTGLTDSTFYVPDYSKTGFTLHYYVLNGTTYYDTTPSLVVSGNTSANVIDVYYQRAWNSLQIYTNNGSNYSLSPYCQSFDGYNYSCSYYYGTEITINNYIWNYDEGYSFSGWNIDSEYSLPDDAYLSDEGISFLMPDHPVYIGLETNHILYRLTFTGYEGADVMNADSMYVSLTGENYYRFDSEIELPYLDKPGYNFMGWNSGDYNEWSSYYSSDLYHPIRHMPSHDVELTAEFSPRTDMEYYKYYYFQDTEGTGYSLSGYDRYEDGTTDQRVSSNCTYVEGFTHSRGEPDILYIKATGDNYINCYYDRDEYMVDVIYDDSKLSISGTGYYRYEAPVNLTATVKTGYEFSGFSSEWPEYNTTDSTLSFNVPLGGSYPIYAYAKPIVYSIEYEMYGGWLTPYQWYITGYTVDGDYDLGIFDAVKDGYTFLGWTGGEIGVREVTEPTKGLVIPLGSIGNRKYFANFQPNEENVVVNYYLKKIDAENNTLTGGVDIYLTGVVFTGLMDDVINISGAYLKEIEGYHYDHATVYSGEDEITAIETTILANGSREINMYYIPNKYNFTLNSEEHSSIEGSSESTGYYYGAKVALSGDSNNDCYIWSGWITNGITLSDNTLNQTGFTMPANNVIVAPSVREMTYNIVFSGNGSTSGEMSSMMGVRCTESTGLILNSFQKIGYRFTGWSTIPGSNTGEYTDGQSVSGLSKNDGVDVNLYAVWDANDVSMHIFHLSETLSGNTLRLETESVLTKVGFFYSGEVKTFTGFRYNPLDSRNITGRIASWDGSQNEILLYYTRDEYPVTITNEGEGTTSETTGGREYLYEEPVTVSVKAYTGWEFVNWTVIEGDLSGANLSGTTLSFSMPAEQVQISPNLNHIPYTVYFNSASGTAVESQTYYYDDLLSGLDSAVTTRSGYSFSGWYLGDVLYNADSKMPAENITLTAKWKAETGIQYQVNHRGENIEGTAYNVLLLNETKYGETDARTLANSGEFEGFTLSGDVEQKKINPSGTTVVDIYYSRNNYLISFKDGDGNIIQTGMVAYGETPEYTGATPTKTATAQYTYTFNDSRSPELTGVTAAQVYTAQFDSTVNEYLITFVDGDGNTIQSGMVAYGDTPIYSGATPTKTATAQYSYTFNDTWSPAIEEVTTGAAYTAQFDKTTNSYSATISSNNTGYGTVSPESVTGQYGASIEISGNVLIISGENVVATPNDATAQYSYAFSGWNNTCGDEITGNCTITAEFTRTVNKYLIIFKDGDESVIQSGMVAYGETPEYTGATPTKTATAQYSYTFNDTWSPAIEEVTTGATYTAQFNSTTNEYLITFIDGDGNTIQTGMVAYGETPEYTGATPTKTATAQYTYTFNDTWSPAIENVTTGATYTAQFSSIVNKYLITFVDGDGNTIQSGMVAYGETPEYTGAIPTKTATAQYTYTFNDTWSPSIEQVTTGATYTAQFYATTNTYTATITSNNTGYGTVIPESVTGTYGDSIVISGNELSISGQNVVASPNEATAQYTYTFSGWNNTCGDEITGNCTITAEFTRTVNEYLITFVDGDENTIQTGMVAYGETPEYTGATPTKTTTPQYTYTFNDTRSPLIEQVTTGVTYTAQFDATTNSYTISIIPNDTSLGTISTGEITVIYGSPIVESGNKITIGGTEIVATPNEPDAQYTYGFDGWTNTCGSELTGTCTIQTNFKKTLNKYTITWKNEDGTVIDTTQVAYGTMPTHVKPTKAETEDYRYVFAGWTPELTKVVGNAEYTATFTEEEKEKSSGGNNMSGGGGRRGKSWKTENSDNQHGAAEENLNGNEYTGDVVANDINEDIVPLYKWTYENNVTTMDTLEDADPDGLLTRGHLAKMVVNYMVNVLGRSMPYDITYNCLYWGDDESSWESDEIRDYATKACAFGVMGINMEDNKFLPNNIVTRAEFGTVMSRVLWGDRYDIIDTNNRMYYEDHLQALKKDDIMTQIANPENRWEIRKWVWLVFRRVMEKKK